MRGGASRGLVRSLWFHAKSVPADGIGRYLERVRPFSAASRKNSAPSPPPRRHDRKTREPGSGIKRDSMILDMFRRRQMEGPAEGGKRGAELATDAEADCGAAPADTEVVSCFEELGMNEEMTGAIGDLGIVVPSEVQCIGIPEVLEGKNLVLLGSPQSGRTLAYLLPLVQRLREDVASFGLNQGSPRAIVLCPSEDLCNQVFSAAKLISDRAQSKSVSGVSPVGKSEGTEDSSSYPIGMLVGTPEEILQQINDEDIALTDIRYLVLDEAEIMLDGDHFPKINKIFNMLNNGMTEDPSFQTILVATINKKMLGEELLKSLEQKESGEVTAVVMAMDQAEVPDLFKSPDALHKRVTEAVRSLDVTPQVPDS